jgi:hypothetical protein
MQKKLYQVLASGSEMPIILATKTICETKKNIPVKAYRSGKLTILSNAIASPFNPLTGKAFTDHAGDHEIAAELANELTTIGKCSNEQCGVYHKTTASTAAQLIGSHYHCPICAHETLAMDEDQLIEEEMMESDSEDELMDDDLDMDMDESEELEDMSDDTYDDLDDQIVESSEDMGAEDAEEPEEDAPLESFDQLSPEELEEFKQFQNELLAQITEQVAEMAKSAQASAQEPEDSEEMMEEEDEVVEASIQVNLLQHNMDAIQSGELDIVRCGDRWHLFANQQPVACFERDLVKSPAVLNSFDDSTKFSQLVEAALQNGLTNEFFVNFGVKPTVATISTSKVFEREVQAKVQEIKNHYSNESREFKNRYSQCLSMAGVALSKNLLKDVKNPLTLELCASLESIGVHQPEAIVQNSWRTSGEDFLRAIFAKADHYMNMNDQARNEIAANLRDIEHQTDAQSSRTNTQIINKLNNGNRVTQVTSSVVENKKTNNLEMLSSIFFPR